MNTLRKIYFRSYQTALRTALPVLPYRDPKILPSISEVPKVLRDTGHTAALLVTDETMGRSRAAKQLVSDLEASGVKTTVFDWVEPNPTVHNVDAAAKQYWLAPIKNPKKIRYPRAIIALGGGSVIDCAKAVGAKIAYPRKPLGDMEGILKVNKPIPTLVAIPTTAGTGSEATLAAVITDREHHHKYAINSFSLIPRYAVLDPAVTVSLPPHLTATTGLDALTHAVEAYIGRSTTHKTRRLALDAVSLIFNNLETAYNDGTDLTARRHMLEAAYKAGQAFSQSYVGYVHALAHSLGGQYNIPHGLANAVLLPVVLRAYGAPIWPKLNRLARAAGVADDNDSVQSAASAFIEAIENLNQRLRIPTTIPEIVAADIPKLAKHADREANPLYPVPVIWDQPQLEKIYRQVLEP